MKKKNIIVCTVNLKQFERSKNWFFIEWFVLATTLMRIAFMEFMNIFIWMTFPIILLMVGIKKLLKIK